MKWFRVSPVLLLILVVVVCLAAGSISTLNHPPGEPRPKFFDRTGQHVEVKGVVDYLYVSTGGKPYEVFFLCDTDWLHLEARHLRGCTLVFTHGHPNVRSGETLYVRGKLAPIRGAAKGVDQVVADPGWLR